MLCMRLRVAQVLTVCASISVSGCGRVCSGVCFRLRLGGKPALYRPTNVGKLCFAVLPHCRSVTLWRSLRAGPVNYFVLGPVQYSSASFDWVF